MIVAPFRSLLAVAHGAGASFVTVQTCGGDRPKAGSTLRRTERGVPCSEPTGLVVYRGDTMTTMELLRAEDLDVPIVYPDGLERVLQQGLADLTPWHMMDRDAAKQRLRGLRERYKAKYVPFARRQDNDDIACIDPELPGHVVVVHDFASEGHERRRHFDSFWRVSRCG